MTKIVILFSKIVAATLVALSLTSCNGNFNLGNSVKGSGNVITEKRNASDFNKITVANGLDCEVVQADNFEVTVEADDNLINGIKTKVENNTLIIYSEYNNYINVTAKKITVRLPKVLSLETTSGASLQSGNLLTGEDIKLKSSSGSTMEVEVEADKVTLESTSGSEQQISGKALKLYTASSSGSNIDADELLANEVYAQSSSGSSTSVNAIVLLDGKASSGSSISYSKSPKEIRVEESSGGSVSKD
jgi:hypothetical protein